MKTLIVWLFLTVSAYATPITYHMYSGSVIDGHVTTDGKIGLLTAADITGWNWKDNWNRNGSDAPITLCSNVYATLEYIYFEANSILDLGGLHMHSDGYGVHYEITPPNPNANGMVMMFTNPNPIVNNPIVPEPSSIVLCAIMLGTLLFKFWT